jgi:iron-sulfur cluster assembly protein
MANIEISNPSRNRIPLPPLMQLTDAAVERLRMLYQSHEGDSLLRIGVKAKGCSGMSYDLTWVTAAAAGDEVISDQGVTVLVDRAATLFLIGTTMDYQRGAMETGFVFINPNEKGRCGCGESFHV